MLGQTHTNKSTFMFAVNPAEHTEMSRFCDKDYFFGLFAPYLERP